MISLLDVNVIIPILDQDHLNHDVAFDWFEQNRGNGWASCCLTETGVIRILSGSGYRANNSFSTYEIRKILGLLIGSSRHEFWSADISIMDGGLFREKNILGPNQITDVYLLGLAVKNGGRLVSFDHRIALESVVGADDANLVLL